MSKTGKRLLALLLCMVMFISLLPAPALAEGTITAADEGTISRDDGKRTIEETVPAPEEEPENVGKGEITLQEVYINPLYADVISEEDLVAQKDGVKDQKSRAVFLLMKRPEHMCGNAW